MTFDPRGDEKNRSTKQVEATRAGDADEISKLTSEPSGFNAKETASGETAMLADINTNQLATSACLLKQHADISLRDNSRNAPGYLTMIRGDSALAMVQMLLVAVALTHLWPNTGNHARSTLPHICCATVKVAYAS